MDPKDVVDAAKLKDGEVAVSKEELDTLKDKAGKTDAISTQLSEAQDTLASSGYLDHLDKQEKGEEEEKGKKGDIHIPDPVVKKVEGTAKPLDEMSNAELHTHTMTGVGDMLKDYNKGLNDRLDVIAKGQKDTAKTASDSAAISTMKERVREVAEAKDKDGKELNPGFWDVRKEMYAMSLKNPNMDPQDAYDAVMGSKNKGEHTRLKTEETARTVEKGIHADSEKPIVSIPVKTAEGKPANVESAFDAAWNKHVGAGKVRVG